MDYPAEVENHAQRIVAQLISRQAETSLDADDTASTGDRQSVDVDSLQLVRPRTVGVEHVGLWAMEQVGLRGLLAQLGLNSRQQAAAVGSIIGRLAAPGSERATHRWLRETSAPGRFAGGRLRELQPDAAIPGFRRADGASGGD